jgi:prophage regulatory protein
MPELPSTGYLRLKQIIGDKKLDIPAIIPISRTQWWRGVREGKYPQSVKLGPRTTAWTVSSIKQLVATFNADVR